ncbi:unnamed protein product [Amoebophrya sp. A120]|nr:unnamed protein product [Amoebophrya sp. A120]|eukprot:GSA120T00005594001.1
MFYFLLFLVQTLSCLFVVALATTSVNENGELEATARSNHDTERGRGRNPLVRLEFRALPESSIQHRTACSAAPQHQDPNKVLLGVDHTETAGGEGFSTHNRTTTATTTSAKIPRFVLYSFPPNNREARLFLQANEKYIGPEWTPVFLDDETCVKNFVAFRTIVLQTPDGNTQRYTPTQIQAVFDNFSFGAHKADLCRYHFAFVKGGVMIDSDALLAENLSDIIDRGDADYVGIRAQLRSFSIGLRHSCHLILGSTAGNPIMRDALWDILQWKKNAWMWGPVDWRDNMRQFLVPGVAQLHYMRHQALRKQAKRISDRSEEYAVGAQEPSHQESESISDQHSLPIVHAAQYGYDEKTKSLAGKNRMTVTPVPPVVSNYRRQILAKQINVETGAINESQCGFDQFRLQLRAILRVAEFLWRQCLVATNFAGRLSDPSRSGYHSEMEQLRDCARTHFPFIADALVFRRRSRLLNRNTRRFVIAATEYREHSEVAAFLKELELSGYGTSLWKPLFLAAQTLVFYTLDPRREAEQEQQQNTGTTTSVRDEHPNRGTIGSLLLRKNTTERADQQLRPNGGASSTISHGRWVGPLHYQNFNAKLWQLMHKYNTTQKIRYLDEHSLSALADPATILVAPEEDQSVCLELVAAETALEEGGDAIDTESSSLAAPAATENIDVEIKFELGPEKLSSHSVNVTFTDLSLLSTGSNAADGSHPDDLLHEPSSVAGVHVHDVIAVQQYVLENEKNKDTLTQAVTNAASRALSSRSNIKAAGRETTRGERDVDNDQSQKTIPLVASQLYHHNPPSRLALPRIVATHHSKDKCPAFWIDDLELPREKIAYDTFWNHPEHFTMDCTAPGVDCGYPIQDWALLLSLVHDTSQEQQIQKFYVEINVADLVLLHIVVGYVLFWCSTHGGRRSEKEPQLTHTCLFFSRDTKTNLLHRPHDKYIDRLK